MTKEAITPDDFSKLRLGAIAKEFNVSKRFVRQILKGETGMTTPVQKKIYAKALEILNLHQA